MMMMTDAHDDGGGGDDGGDDDGDGEGDGDDDGDDDDGVWCAAREIVIFQQQHHRHCELVQTCSFGLHSMLTHVGSSSRQWQRAPGASLCISLSSLAVP